jgi:hypothetical protein
MPKIQASAVKMGLAFVVACTVPIVVGGPWLRLFFGLGAAGGLVVAAILHLREWSSGSLAGTAVKEDLQHPAIARHKIHDLGGVLLVVACATAVLVGMPTVWHFFAVAIGAGLVVAAVLHWAHG